MNLRILGFCILFIFINTVFGESLWEPDFSGYFSSGKALKPGDTIVVAINTETSLSFVSSSSNDKTLTFEFTGGDVDNLLSFLPAVKTSGNNKLKGDESIKLESEVVTIVRTIDENGNAYLEGFRNIEIDGKAESLQLTGTIPIHSIGSDKKVKFSQLANSRLVYNTFVMPAGNILTEADIVQAVSELTAGTEPAAGTIIPSPAPEVPAAVPGTTSPVSPLPGGNNAAPAYTLSDAKKKELLLNYINKFINFIFN